MVVVSFPGIASARLHAERGQRLLALAPCLRVDARIDARAVAVHRHLDRTEVANPKPPQALRIEIVEIDILDRLDPGGLERGGASDHCEVRAAEFAERGERGG